MKYNYGNNENVPSDSKEYLYINSCGRHIHVTSDYCMVRKNGRRDYHILFIISGECYLTALGKEYVLKKGDAAVYLPWQPQKYTYYANTENECIWVHFSGIGIKDFLSRCNFEKGPVYREIITDEIITILSKMLTEHSLKYEHYKSISASLFSTAMLMLGRNIIADNKNYKAFADRKFPDVIGEMNTHLNKTANIARYATLCSMSKNRFMHAFKEITGISPYKYHLSLRLERAKYLLENTTLNVSEVSDSMGFSDPLYFSKIFKKYIGVSPSCYKSKRLQ